MPLPSPSSSSPTLARSLVDIASLDLTARVEMPIERAFGSALPFARRAMPDVDARSDASSDASEGEWIAAVVAAERVHALVDALRAVAVEHESANQNAAESAPNANEGAVRARARARRARYARACRELTAAIDGDRACAEEASRANAREAVEAFGDADADERARDARTVAVAACERAVGSVERYKTCTFHGIEVRVLETALANGVGARLWNAARTLSERLARAPETVRGKTVLEVGAGVGTCGILAAKLGARSVTLSDFEEPLLEALDRSVVENGCAATCSARALDWRRELERAPTPTTNPRRAPLADDEVFDVIIGSDVLYEREHVLALPACVDRRLAADGACWLVNASRYAGMFEELVDALRARRLRVDVLHDDDAFLDDASSTRPIKVKDWHDDFEKTVRVVRASPRD